MAEAIGIQRRIHSNLGEPKPDLERRGKIGEVLSFISKFAFESTVIQSLRISTGRKREQSKDDAFPVPSDGENLPRDPKLVTEEMQAKIEKMREDIDRAKQRRNITSPVKCLETLDNSSVAKIDKMQREMENITLQCKASSASRVEGSGLAKKPDGGDAKGLDFLGKNGKRVFIRSRM